MTTPREPTDEECAKNVDVEPGSKLNAVIGGDPGSQGAVVLITECRRILVHRFKDFGYQETANVINYWFENYNVVKTFCELNAFRPQDLFNRIRGGNKGGGDSQRAGGFMKRHSVMMLNNGELRGMLRRAPLVLVPAQVWQRHHAVCFTGISKDERVRKYTARAKLKYPGIKVTQDTSAAIMIADYGWWEVFGI